MILHLGTNDVLYKSGTNILKDLIELKDFILEKLPSCNKITLLLPRVHTDKWSAKKNKIFTSRLKEQGIPYIKLDNIIHKYLYRDALHLNWVSFSILAQNFLSYIRRNWLQIETQNQRKNIKVSSSKIQQKTAII